MISQTVWPSAPLDPAAVAQALLPFGESRMLPRAAYVDQAVFEWEKQHMFGGGWVFIARSDQVASPGDMRAEPLGASSVPMPSVDQTSNSCAPIVTTPVAHNRIMHTFYWHVRT